MLVEFPYIDAMALFDREQLIKLGGYDNELYKLGWFGWEDYDLWLRIAGAELSVSFLPNVLCLYRHHEKAMSNTTNLFERELVAHLFEKHRALIEMYPPKKRFLELIALAWKMAETSAHERKGAGVYRRGLSELGIRLRLRCARLTRPAMLPLQEHVSASGSCRFLYLPNEKSARSRARFGL